MCSCEWSLFNFCALQGPSFIRYLVELVEGMILSRTQLGRVIRNCRVNLRRLAAKMTPEFSINRRILLREKDISLAVSLALSHIGDNF